MFENNKYELIEKDINKLIQIDYTNKKIIFKKGLTEIEKWFLFIYQLINLCFYELKRKKIIRKGLNDIATIYIAQTLLKTLVYNNIITDITVEELEKLYADTSYKSKYNEVETKC